MIPHGNIRCAQVTQQTSSQARPTCLRAEVPRCPKDTPSLGVPALSIRKTPTLPFPFATAASDRLHVRFPWTSHFRTDTSTRTLDRADPHCIVGASGCGGHSRDLVVG